MTGRVDGFEDLVMSTLKRLTRKSRRAVAEIPTRLRVPLLIGSIAGYRRPFSGGAPIVETVEAGTCSSVFPAPKPSTRR